MGQGACCQVRPCVCCAGTIKTFCMWLPPWPWGDIAVASRMGSFYLKEHKGLASRYGLGKAALYVFA